MTLEWALAGYLMGTAQSMTEWWLQRTGWSRRDAWRAGLLVFTLAFVLLMILRPPSWSSVFGGQLFELFTWPLLRRWLDDDDDDDDDGEGKLRSGARLGREKLLALLRGAPRPVGASGW